MTGRPSVNKRLREVLRKERQAEKVLRRDQRRTQKKLPPFEDGVTGEPTGELGDVATGEGAPPTPPPLEE